MELFITVTLFLVSIVFGLIAYIGAQMASSLKGIEHSVKGLAIKLAIHDEKFKTIEGKLSA